MNIGDKIEYITEEGIFRGSCIKILEAHKEISDEDLFLYYKLDRCHKLYKSCKKPSNYDRCVILRDTGDYFITPRRPLHNLKFISTEASKRVLEKSLNHQEKWNTYADEVLQENPLYRGDN